ncbi:MAG TPA: Crp/Fnr family transcriptional regulator [Caulobacteraceae bacterium]|nr:Crp/Fnr family transcriptional regulator [Caulobacteraceae bacterium]
MAGPLDRAKNRLLAALTSEDFSLLAPHLSMTDLERGRLLYDPGDPLTSVYFPTDGVVSMLTLMESGEAIENATIGREGALGLQAATGSRESLSRAIVQVTGRAYKIAAAPVQELWRRSAPFRDIVERHQEAVHGHAIQSVACNALHSVEARFCRWLLACRERIDTDSVHLTQEFLADMLGVQRTTVTAVAQSMQNKGLIRYRRGMVDILDRQGLETVACECYGAVKRTYQRLFDGT